MVSKKKILILGGEGFIGRNLSDVLSKGFKCFSIGLEKSIFPGSKAEFINIDPYKEKVSGHYDIVIQLIDNHVQLSDIKKTEKKILDNLDLISPEHIIVFSSASIYMFPDSEYAKRKLLMEKIYKKYCHEKRIGLSILRLFNIFGPYQLPNKQGSLVANILYNYYAKKPIEINDLQAKRDFIYSKDMAKCVEAVIKKRLFGTDDLATNKMTTIEELLTETNQLLPKEIKIINKDNKEKEICPNAKSLIINEIGPMPMRQSLEKTIDFYKNNWKLIGDK